MAAQKGRDVLVAIREASNTNTDGTGAYDTVAGLRSTSLTINDETVDVTHKDSSGWRTLLPQAGVQSMSISGSGVFEDSAAEGRVISGVHSATLQYFKLTMPGYGAYTGQFQITSVELAGEYNGEATYSITLESSGEITFTAAA